MQRQPLDIAWDTPVVTLSGVVSAQVQSGEAVTIVVTKPGGGQDSITAKTDAARAFVTLYAPVAGIGYKVVATIGADGRYQAARSATVTFNVPVASVKVSVSWWFRVTSWFARQRKKARTISLKVA